MVITIYIISKWYRFISKLLLNVNMLWISLHIEYFHSLPKWINNWSNALITSSLLDLCLSLFLCPFVCSKIRIWVWFQELVFFTVVWSKYISRKQVFHIFSLWIINKKHRGKDTFDLNNAYISNFLGILGSKLFKIQYRMNIIINGNISSCHSFTFAKLWLAILRGVWTITTFIMQSI